MKNVFVYRLQNWAWLLDYIIIPILIIFVFYQPNFIHGFIDYLEAGKELACINEIFLGKQLYRDVFTLFGPLNIYLEVFSMFLFGKNLAVLRGYFYFGTLATLIIAYLLGRILCRNKFFSYLAILALIVETYHPFWSTRWGGIRFGFGLSAILCAVVFFKKEKNIWAIFAGIFVALAFITTPDTGIFSLIAIGTTFSFYGLSSFLKNKILSLALKNLVFFGIGLFIVLFPFLFYFGIKGALIPYIDTLLILARNHVKIWGQPQPAIDLLKLITPNEILTINFKRIFPAFLYIFLAFYLIRHVFKKRMPYNWREYGILCLSIYGLFMYAASFRAAIGPQFQMALQPVIILGFVFLSELFEQIIKLKKYISSNNNFLKFIVSLIVFIVIIFYAIFSEKIFFGDFKQWFMYQKYKKYLMPTYSNVIPLANLQVSTLKIDRARGLIVPHGQAQEIESVMRYIVSLTNPNEPLFTFPEHGIYNFLANRPCLDRFNIAGLAWTALTWRQELLMDLKKIRPRYIIYSRNLSNLARSIQRTEELLPEVIEYINANYEKEVSFGEIDILRRKEF